MTNAFQYEIKKVDQISGCLEVLFKKEGQPSYLVSVPKPVEGQELVVILQDYAPFALWEQSSAGVVEVDTTPAPVEEAPENAKRIILVSIQR